VVLSAVLFVMPVFEFFSLSVMFLLYEYFCVNSIEILVFLIGNVEQISLLMQMQLYAQMYCKYSVSLLFLAKFNVND